MDDVIKKNALENSLLIIDEAHNLFNAVTNGAKNATALYDLIMKTHNLKLIFLTGTPIVNDPFELVPCFNMCRGKIQMLIGSEVGTKKSSFRGRGERLGGDELDDDIVDYDDTEDVVVNVENNKETKKSISNRDSNDKHNRRDKYKKEVRMAPKDVNKYKHIPDTKQYTSLFSESRDEFENYFIDRTAKSIKNKDKFTNRIFGLTSYYGDLYFPESEGRPGFPKELPVIVENIPMSQAQFSTYIIARHSELDETKKSFAGQDNRFSSSSGGSSTYRVKTRQISNFAIPEYALGPARGMKARKKFVEKITMDDLQNVVNFSPKMARILSNIKKRGKQPGMVYSQFVSGEGLAIFARVLEANGYKDAISQSIDDGSDIKERYRPKFAILSGSISPDDRVNLIKKFNSSDNSDGSQIQILLLSGAVAEGIDLKRIRHVHVMEPFWNYARINQVKTRAIRYESHIDLPIEQQNVQVYIYLSSYPNSYPKEKIKEQTTDVELYTKSMNNMQIINSFLVALAETSIDCTSHYPGLSKEIQEKIKCKMCSPNNMRLFDPLINKDMDLPSNCVPYKEAKVNVQEIIVTETGEKFYYKKDKDKVDIYVFNSKLKGYTPMPRTHRFYGHIMEQILTEESDGKDFKFE
jgi:hypothetical protein